MSKLNREEDDEDVLVELSTSIVTRVDGWDCLQIIRPIKYDKAWDWTVELLVSNEAKEGEIVKSEICGVRIRSSEVREDKAGKREVENCVIV